MTKVDYVAGKLGRKPAVYDKRTLQLSEFEQAAPPTAPVGFGYWKATAGTQNWGMLGNDNYGDCVEAEAAHSTIILNHIANKRVVFNDQCVESDYTAVTGFNPNDPNTDQGTDMLTYANYRRKTGILDAEGNRHQIGAFIQLEPGNWNELLQGLYAFNVVSIGINFPQSAMDQFNAGKSWTVKSGSSIEGGHAIDIVGHPTLNYAKLVTWGRAIAMNKAFYTKYCEEAYVYISQEDLVAGKSPLGYDLTELSTILSQL